MTGAPGDPFDVRAYSRRPHTLRPDRLDVAALSEPRLDPPALDVLQYLERVERGASQQLRNVLLTPSHTDATVTAFLTTWAYEQHWLADCLGAVLAANRRRGADATPRGWIAAARERLDDRVLPMWNAVTTNLVGADFVAAHMVGGLLDASVGTFAYRRLARLDGRPALVRLVDQICSAKDQHVRFYASQARERLGRSARARAFTRTMIALGWSWPGSRHAGRAETAAVLGHLVGADDHVDALADIDAKVAGLPGLHGLRVVRHAVTRYRPSRSPGRVWFPASSP
jgi:hypothetical protein